MFRTAIETVGAFTRPIHFISNVYGEKEVRPGAATLFFVNDEGVAITCKHVSSLIRQEAIISKQYLEFQNEKNSLNKSASYNKKIKELKQRYGYDKDDNVCQMLNQFVDCADFKTIDITEHPVYDLAIVKMKSFTKKLYSGHAVFAKDTSSLQPGLFVCRLGFPFPEFTNFKYDAITETISFTGDIIRTVRFPIEGMVTRHLADAQGKIVGIEISTPGLKGQSGGALFAADGLIYGMQNITNHLHLGFDLKNHEMLSGGKKIRVTNQPLLHVGHCIHADVIKEFLREQQVQFFEA